jgi:hypothetical protein
MLDGVQLDLGASATLAVVYVVEGFRRVPAGAAVMRNVLWNDWQIEHDAADRSRWLLASWTPPITTSLVIPEWDGAPKSRRPSAAVKVTRWQSILLTISTSIILALLIIGLPTAAASRGSLGFLAALGVLVVLCVAQAVYVGRKLRAAVPGSSLLKTMLPLLSPFRAPRALEMLREAQFRSLGPLQAARTLLPQAVFEHLIRAMAFDRITAGARHPELDACLSAAELRRIVNTVPEHDGPYCQRCGATYVIGAATCSSCEITLVGGASHADAALMR